MGQEEDQNCNRIHNEIWVTCNVTIVVRMIMFKQGANKWRRTNLRDMNKDDTNSQTNVVISVEEEDDLFLATNDKVIKTRWVMDFVASKHICRDREMLDTLKTDGEFDNFKLGNGGKIKVEGIGSMRMKLYNGAIQTFSNVRLIPFVVVNIISMG